MSKTSLKKYIISISLWFSKIISLTFIIFLMLEIFSSFAIKSLPNIAHMVYTRSLRNIERDSRESSPQYTDTSYSKIVFSDLTQYRERYNPYTVWISDKIGSRTLNIDERGVRKTYNPPVNKNTNKKIFIFGASTLFGLGTDDDHTIPSILSKIINKNSKNRYEVINYGTLAYISSQELNRLIIELRRNNIPDYVIFYDGIADILFGVYNPGFPGAHFHYYETALSYNHHGFLNLIYSSYSLKLIGYTIERLYKRYQKSSIRDIDNKIARMLNNYKKNIEIVHALSKSYGFKYYIFFQPVLCAAKKPMTDYEKKIYDNSGVLNIIFRKAYDEIKKVDFKGYRYYNISDAFDKIDKDIYIDFAHVGAFGNEIIAETIYKHIKQDIY